MKYSSLILILSICFINCKKNDSDRKYIRGQINHRKISKQEHRLIQNKSLSLIDSVLGKTPVLEEREYGFTYSNDDYRYYTLYRIDTTYYKIIRIEFDLNMNVVNWDTVIYVP